jgi:hypothetical protein
MIAIMQPYFFPYVGYFQLIAAVKTYVNLDHVSFMKRSYMTRNSIKSGLVNLQVNGASQNKSCREVTVNFDHNYLEKFLKQLDYTYKKSPYYNVILDRIIVPEFYERDVCVSDFNMNLIRRITEYAGITTDFINTSTVFSDLDLKKQHGLISICNQMDETVYVNAIGGQSLYTKQEFSEKGIDLRFIRMKKLTLKDPYISILHHLMEASQQEIHHNFKQFEII